MLSRTCALHAMRCFPLSRRPSHDVLHCTRLVFQQIGAVAALLLFLCGRASGITNPTLAQRDISYFAPTGTDAIQTGIWTIKLNGAVIATDTSPHGWYVRMLAGPSDKIFSVTTPQPPWPDAVIATNYEVLYYFTGYSGGGDPT